MTTEELKELKGKITPGSWVARKLEADGFVIRGGKEGWEISTPEYDVAANIQYGAPIRKEADAKLFALAPSLLDECLEMRARLEVKDDWLETELWNFAHATFLDLPEGIEDAKAFETAIYNGMKSAIIARTSALQAERDQLRAAISQAMQDMLGMRSSRLANVRENLLAALVKGRHICEEHKVIYDKNCPACQLQAFINSPDDEGDRASLSESGSPK